MCNEATMSSVEYLRDFVNERLTAAAEEIFGVFKNTIIEYEEEIYRQRRLLDIVWKPEIKLHRIELPQQHVCKEKEVLPDQQLCIQERDSSLDQEEPEPPQIKEEQEELCTSQEEQQLELKQETDTFMLTPTYEESDLQLHSLYSRAAGSQDQKGEEHGGAGSTRNAEPKPQKRPYKSNSDNVKCDICGNVFKFKSDLQKHLMIHTGEKPYTCETCGKTFRCSGNLKGHMGIHTGEKPYSCSVCGKRFRKTSALNDHKIIHTGEKPFTCEICGGKFRCNSNLKSHMRRIHTGEKQYSCKTWDSFQSYGYHTL